MDSPEIQRTTGAFDAYQNGQRGRARSEARLATTFQVICFERLASTAQVRGSVNTMSGLECMAKIDIPFESDEEISELVELFEACRWPYERWTHRAHVAVAASYLTSLPLDAAIDRIRGTINRYNRVCGDPTGYHETITVVLMRIVADFLRNESAGLSLVEIVDELASTRTTKRVLLRHYSAEVLFSPEAKARLVEPDLEPLAV